MSNNYYTFTPRFIPGTKVRAGAVNQQFDLLEDAFDLLPTDPASIAQGKSTLGVESGSGDAYVVTMTPVRTVNASGDEVVFKATHQNSGASTLQVDSITAASLVRWNGDPLSAADILSGSYYVARYDSVNTRFMIVAPAQSTIVGALTYAAPTASIGLTAVAGVATTVMRSDAAPALSPGIAPTWTAVHTFSAVPVFSAGISVTGNATASGLFLGGAGAVGGPTFSFSSDPNTGAYSVGADDWGVATGGTLRFDISTTVITSTLPNRGAAGSATAPTWSFSGDPNTGAYSVGADDWGVATNGVLRFDISTTAVTSTLPWLGQDGAVGAPSLSFSGDADTGFYRIGANNIGLAVNGGKVVDVRVGSIDLMPTGTLSAGLQVQANVCYFPDGSVGTPGLTFQNDTNTGIYRLTTDIMAFSTGGVARLLMGTGMSLQTGVMAVPDGSVSNPSYTFTNFTSSGLYTDNGAVRTTVSGTQVFAVGAAGVFGLSGTEGGPFWSYLTDSDTGVYNAGGSNALSLSSGGTMFFQGALGINTVTLGFNSSTTLFLRTTGSTSASAGGVATLPATVLGYITLTINGTTGLKIPYYAT